MTVDESLRHLNSHGFSAAKEESPQGVFFTVKGDSFSCVFGSEERFLQMAETFNGAEGKDVYYSITQERWIANK